MPEQAEGLAVRQSVIVAAPPERAFDVFTAGFGSWWPLESHHLLEQDVASVEIEPRVGGAWQERGADGTECRWGRVLTWDPPHRLVMSWQINAEWAVDESIYTEVEVTFAPEGDGTRVVLEHRGLESYGDKADDMRETFGADGGWTGLLRTYAEAAAAAA